jgi:CRP-like cAMP-binding protein
MLKSETMSREPVIVVTEDLFSHRYKRVAGEGDMASTKSLIPSPELQAEFEGLATVVFKPKGTLLFRRGDDVCGVFLIRRGKVRLSLDCETPLYPSRVLGPGAITGLPATVSGQPYSLTAKVVEDSELAFVPRDAVLSCLRNNLVLCFQVMDMLSGEICDIRSAYKRNSSTFRARAGNSRLTKASPVA